MSNCPNCSYLVQRSRLHTSIFITMLDSTKQKGGAASQKGEPSKKKHFSLAEIASALDADFPEIVNASDSEADYRPDSDTDSEWSSDKGSVHEEEEERGGSFQWFRTIQRSLENFLVCSLYSM